MKIQTEMVGDIAIVRLVGEFDSRSNDQIDNMLRDLAYKEIYKVILDVTLVRFIGVQTLNVVIHNLKEMRAGGGDIYFLNPHRRVIDYLKQNRLFEIFKIFTSRREAVDSFLTGDPSGPKAVPIVEPEPESPRKTLLNNSQPQAASDSKDHAAQQENHADFESGSMLFANSCMLASMIHLLQKKGVITEDEAETLLGYDSLSIVRDSVSESASTDDKPTPSSQQSTR